MEQYPSDNFIPQREPNEVTLEYVAEPKPYVAYYVQDRPLPGRKPETAAQEPPAKTRRKGHRGLKIFLICLAAVLVLAGGLYAAWWFGLLPDRFYGGDHGDYYDNPDYYYYYGELDESAEPELPVVSADDGVRLVYADGHGDALTIQEIYRRVNPSTVTVVTELPRGASVGTGVILTEDGTSSPTRTSLPAARAATSPLRTARSSTPPSSATMRSRILPSSRRRTPTAARHRGFPPRSSATPTP